MERDKFLSILNGTFTSSAKEKQVAPLPTIIADEVNGICAKNLLGLFCNHKVGSSVKISLPSNQLLPLF